MCRTEAQPPTNAQLERLVPLQLKQAAAMASCMSQCPAGVVRTPAKAALTPYTGLARISLPTAKVAKKSQWVSNGIKTRQMMVWQPVNNK